MIQNLRMHQTLKCKLMVDPQWLEHLRIECVAVDFVCESYIELQAVMDCV